MNPIRFLVLLLSLIAAPAFAGNGNGDPGGNSGGGSGTVTSVTFTGDGIILSSTPSSAVTASGTVTATRAAQTANTVLGALTATGASGLAVPSCSTSASALMWTSGTGFGCNASIAANTAATVTGATQASITSAANLVTIGTITSGTWNGGIVVGTYGGTGVNNGAKTLTLGGSLTTTGAATPTLAFGASGFTFTYPTATSTLAALSVAQTWAAVQTFTNSDIKLLGSSTGATTLTSGNAGASNFVFNLPAYTGYAVATQASAPAQGDILYFDGSLWQDLAPGTSGNFLKTQGASANPVWASVSGSGTVTSIATTSPITGGTITTTGTIACGSCVTSSSPGAGIAHFAGSTQAVTSSPVSLTADVSGITPVANGGTNSNSAGITAFNNITGYSAAGATGTTTGSIVFSISPALTGSPTAPTQAVGDISTDIATDQFVQNAIAAQVDMHDPVVAATTTALTFSPTYSNGTSGVGATLTAGTVGVLVIDGVTPTIGQRVLVQNQAASLQNGCYTLTTVGVVVTTDYVLTRCTDSNQISNITYGVTFPVLQGTANANQQFTMNSQTLTTIGAAGSTGLITFAQTSGGSQLIQGTGITITGNTIALTVPVVVSSGGTNCTSASITCFNNITGLSAAGTTGTTSTNLVFSTSPSLASPTFTGTVAGANTIPLSILAQTATNTVLVNATSGTANVTAQSVSSCSSSASALIWTTNTGFGCNTSIAASTVTTNANLTGVITSSGNATSTGAQTGTGNTFVMSAAPSITGTLTGATSTWSGTVAIGSTSNNSEALYVTGGAAADTGLTTLSISTATFTPTFNTSNDFSITLVHASCPCTLANPSGTITPGQHGIIYVIQSATGSDTITTWGSQYMAPGGTSSITLSTGASAIDVLSYAVQDATHIVIAPVLNVKH